MSEKKPPGWEPPTMTAKQLRGWRQARDMEARFAEALEGLSRDLDCAGTGATIALSRAIAVSGNVPAVEDILALIHLAQSQLDRLYEWLTEDWEDVEDPNG